MPELRQGEHLLDPQRSSGQVVQSILLAPVQSGVVVVVVGQHASQRVWRQVSVVVAVLLLVLLLLLVRLLLLLLLPSLLVVPG